MDNLIIIHLMGQHVDAKNRYPDIAQYNYFSKDSILRKDSYLTDTKKQEIAEYDNATRYNDEVIKKVIDFNRDKNSVIVYFSDHGEEIYDYRDHKGRDLSSSNITYDYLRSQHEIPFMIWCSDLFLSNNPTTIKMIKSSIDKPFMTDNLSHLLFHLGGIMSSYYKPKKDLLGEGYECGKRIVHDTDYDVIRFNE